MSKTQAETIVREVEDVIPAHQGSGPLLERDYFAVIDGAKRAPDEVGAMLRDHFEEFAPQETAVFRRSGADGKKTPLEIGDEMEIRIALLGLCKVRVVHLTTCSLTLRTLKGHPEAGRITFGAGRDGQGHLTFRILSRTRASGLLNYLGFLIMGKQLQARCWIRFIDRVVTATGGRVSGRIRVRTQKVAEGPADRGEEDTPTFITCEGPGGG